MNPMEKMVIKYKNDDQERIINDILKIKPKELVLIHCHDIPGRFSIKEILETADSVKVKNVKIKACYIYNQNILFKYGGICLDEFCFETLKISHTLLNGVKIHNQYLKSLKLKCCKFGFIDLNCPNLFELQIKDNHLEHFNIDSDKLINLDLSCNSLQYVDITCQNLQVLDISYNDFRTFQIDTPNLIELDLQECHSLDSFDCSLYPKLEELNISFAHTIARNISELKYLRWVDMTSNIIMDPHVIPCKIIHL